MRTYLWQSFVWAKPNNIDCGYQSIRFIRYACNILAIKWILFATVQFRLLYIVCNRQENGTIWSAITVFFSLSADSFHLGWWAAVLLAVEVLQSWLYGSKTEFGYRLHFTVIWSPYGFGKAPINDSSAFIYCHLVPKIAHVRSKVFPLSGYAIFGRVAIAQSTRDICCRW